VEVRKQSIPWGFDTARNMIKKLQAGSTMIQFSLQIQSVAGRNAKIEILLLTFSIAIAAPDSYPNY